jgi:hypothetical protein
MSAQVPEAQPRAQDFDNIRDALISDQLLNEFDFPLWIDYDSTTAALEEERLWAFPGKAFPVLAKYHRGKQLDDLITRNPWLGHISIPSERHQAAQAFHFDAIQNFTVVNLFIKLQYLKHWGTAFMDQSPLCLVACEILKLVETNRRSQIEAVIPSQPVVPASKTQPPVLASSCFSETKAISTSSSFTPQDVAAAKYRDNTHKQQSAMASTFGDRWARVTARQVATFQPFHCL